MSAVSPLPKWVMLNYAALWKRFSEREFSYEQASGVLGINDNLLSACLMNLRRSGWISARLESKDGRKRVYRLIDPKTVVEGMLK